ncbi:FxsB family cyclophane-forming radical SAM/SPASM peptide maturase [Polymorphospora lycopeni]|uniref:FxsB family cyclophane-forming radical SAM/SPASM peptide maturase n=1 Tax=Polymorphospora lycopeni TaxID=3140240 RepID=A0ABV5CLP4_9ACTN
MSRPARWPEDLDLAALRRTGFRPAPFRQFVVKVHARCNLACDYCYVYTMADQSWRSRPKVMSAAVHSRVCERIAEHARTHALAEVAVVLHGGEPLLAGTGAVERTAELLRTLLPAGTTLSLSVQTNGILLDRPMLSALRRHGYRVGVSLDGDAVGNDRHRRFADGRGSYAQVRAGLDLLTGADFREMFAGLLCTVDLANDPVGTYEALLSFAPPTIDLLLPHGNWSDPPPGRPPTGATPYADWLIAVFDRWYGAPRRETGIRLFEEIIHLLLGGPGRSESVGLSPYVTAVVDTDGAVEQVDTLKSAYPGAPATGRNVDTDAFDAALWHPAVVARQLGAAALSDECGRCDVVRTCGGGCFPHRYRAGFGFRNPSVYCVDLYRLIDHVRRRLSVDLRQRVPAVPSIE